MSFFSQKKPSIFGTPRCFCIWVIKCQEKKRVRTWLVLCWDVIERSMMGAKLLWKDVSAVLLRTSFSGHGAFFEGGQFVHKLCVPFELAVYLIMLFSQHKLREFIPELFGVSEIFQEDFRIAFSLAHLERFLGEEKGTIPQGVLTEKLRHLIGDDSGGLSEYQNPVPNFFFFLFVVKFLRRHWISISF